MRGEGGGEVSERGSGYEGDALRYQNQRFYKRDPRELARPLHRVKPH